MALQPDMIQIKKRPDKDFWSRSSHFLKWLNVIPIAATIAGLFIAYILPKDTSRTPDINKYRIIYVESRIGETERQLEALKIQLQALSKVPDKTPFLVQLDGLASTISMLQTRLTKIESVILDNPEKALEMPLLKKDLDNLEENQIQNLVSMRQSMDQVYDLNKWLLGGMAISIVTLAISNLLKSKSKEKE